MFSPGSTVIHQGSYACVLLLFLCLAWALWRASIVVFGLAALGGILNFALIWILPNPSRISPLHLGAAVVAALGAAAMVAGAVGASPDDSNESIGA
jgi:Na+-transporting methylmalonyl-CoA/oxaloacetate decarboxylase beta subunit